MMTACRWGRVARSVAQHRRRTSAPGVIAAGLVVLVVGVVFLNRSDEPPRLAMPTSDGVTLPTDSDGRTVDVPRRASRPGVVHLRRRRLGAAARPVRGPHHRPRDRPRDPHHAAAEHHGRRHHRRGDPPRRRGPRATTTGAPPARRPPRRPRPGRDRRPDAVDHRRPLADDHRDPTTDRDPDHHRRADDDHRDPTTTEEPTTTTETPTTAGRDRRRPSTPDRGRARRSAIDQAERRPPPVRRISRFCSMKSTST